MNDNYPLESYKMIFIDMNEKPKKIQYPLKEYEIWSGSFLCTGMEGVAAEPTYHGKEKGRNFQDACFRYFLKSEYEQREEHDKKSTYYNTKRFDYDPYKNTYWGCTLFESKKEAYDNYEKHWK